MWNGMSLESRIENLEITESRIENLEITLIDWLIDGNKDMKEKKTGTWVGEKKIGQRYRGLVALKMQERRNFEVLDIGYSKLIFEPHST